jgi:hypothetical protein
MNQQDFKRLYPDLIAPIIQCPEGVPIETCPFIPYWYKQNIHERIDLFSALSQERLEEIRIFHDDCLKGKLEEAEKRKNSQDTLYQVME